MENNKDTSSPWRLLTFKNNSCEFCIFLGFALTGYVISSLQVPDIFDCSSACLRDYRCKSYNFQVPGPLHLCELSSENVFTKPENYAAQADMIYYDAGRVGNSQSTNV